MLKRNTLSLILLFNWLVVIYAEEKKLEKDEDKDFKTPARIQRQGVSLKKKLYFLVWNVSSFKCY